MLDEHTVFEHGDLRVVLDGSDVIVLVGLREPNIGTALTHHHHAVDGLAAREELRLAQDRWSTTPGVSTVATSLALGLEPRRPRNPLHLVAGALAARLPLVDDSVRRIVGRRRVVGFGSTLTATTAPAALARRSVSGIGIVGVVGVIVCVLTIGLVGRIVRGVGIVGRARTLSAPISLILAFSVFTLCWLALAGLLPLLASGSIAARLIGIGLIGVGLIGVGLVRIGLTGNRLVGIVRRRGVGVVVLITLVLVTATTTATTTTAATSTIAAAFIAGAVVVGAFVVGAFVIGRVCGVLGTLVGRVRRRTTRRRRLGRGSTAVGATLRVIRRRVGRGVLAALAVTTAGRVRRGGRLRGKEERAGRDLFGR